MTASFSQFRVFVHRSSSADGTRGWALASLGLGPSELEAEASCPVLPAPGQTRLARPLGASPPLSPG